MNKKDQMMIISSEMMIATLIELLLVVKEHPELLRLMPGNPEDILRSAALKILSQGGMIEDVDIMPEVKDLITKIQAGA